MGVSVSASEAPRGEPPTLPASSARQSGKPGNAASGDRVSPQPPRQQAPVAGGTGVCGAGGGLLGIRRACEGGSAAQLKAEEAGGAARTINTPRDRFQDGGEGAP